LFFVENLEVMNIFLTEQLLLCQSLIDVSMSYRTMESLY